MTSEVDMELRTAAPARGDLYRGHPKGSLAVCMGPRDDERRNLILLGVDQAENPICRPTTNNIEHTHSQFLKYYVRPGENLDDVLKRPPASYRPGLLCSVLADLGRAVITPALHTDRVGIPALRAARLPVLTTSLPSHKYESPETDDARFEFWSVWGTDVDDLKESRRSVHRADIPRVRDLLLETLGLKTPTWFKSKQELDEARNAGVPELRRGALIWVKLPPDENKRLPFVVVSDNALNGADPRHKLVVVIRTVEYQPFHDALGSAGGFVPLVDPRTNENLGHGLIGKPLSAALSMVRGIRVHLGHTAGGYGIFLKKKYPGIMQAIDIGLLKLHG